VLVLDDAKRQIVVLLLREHVTQPGNISGRELAVSGRGALGAYQALVLEEPDLADGQVREIDLQMGQDVADRERRARFAA